MRQKANKRRNKRADCFVPVEGLDGSVFDHIKTVDIGRGGIGLISAKSLPLDKKIVLELDLTEEGEPAMVMGQVKWVRKMGDSGMYRIGLKFMNVLFPGSRNRLKKYLSG